VWFGGGVPACPSYGVRRGCAQIQVTVTLKVRKEIRMGTTSEVKKTSWGAPKSKGKRPCVK